MTKLALGTFMMPLLPKLAMEERMMVIGSVKLKSMDMIRTG